MLASSRMPAGAFRNLLISPYREEEDEDEEEEVLLMRRKRRIMWRKRRFSGEGEQEEEQDERDKDIYKCGGGLGGEECKDEYEHSCSTYTMFKGRLLPGESAWCMRKPNKLPSLC